MTHREVQGSNPKWCTSFLLGFSFLWIDSSSSSREGLTCYVPLSLSKLC
uniref:Predicted protein n=1 Tax=Hordeum vulgare subsp. vulgare TaxID=112509 RepID=F2ED66_HORVV|nr:predicted protein [Hordeum vulgare subsp. vulgare]